MVHRSFSIKCFLNFIVIQNSRFLVYKYIIMYILMHMCIHLFQ